MAPATTTKGGNPKRKKAPKGSRATKSPKDPFTEQQRKFVQNYLRHGRPSRAYREAGYECKPEYVAKSANVVLNLPHVAAFIAEHRKEQRERFQVDEDRIMLELGRIAFGSLNSFLKPAGDGAAMVTTFEDVTEDDMAMLEEVTVDTYFEGHGDDAKEVKRTKIKLVSKIKAIELLGKKLKLWTDRIELDGNVDISSKIIDARRRLHSSTVEMPSADQDGPAEVVQFDDGTSWGRQE